MLDDEVFCGSEHPTAPGVTCDKKKPCLGYHASIEHDVEWGFTDLPDRVSLETVSVKLHAVRDKTDPPTKTGPPIVGIVSPRSGARATDPVTSKESAKEVQVRAGSYRAQILAVYITAQGIALTDVQASRLAKMPDRSCWWKRCSELRQGGYIEDTGEVFHDPETDKDVMLCRATEKGFSARI